MNRRHAKRKSEKRPRAKWQRKNGSKTKLHSRARGFDGMPKKLRSANELLNYERDKSESDELPMNANGNDREARKSARAEQER